METEFFRLNENYHRPHLIGTCVKNRGVWFIEFAISNSTISTVFRQPPNDAGIARGGTRQLSGLLRPTPPLRMSPCRQERPKSTPDNKTKAQRLHETGRLFEPAVRDCGTNKGGSAGDGRALSPSKSAKRLPGCFPVPPRSRVPRTHSCPRRYRSGNDTYLRNMFGIRL